MTLPDLVVCGFDDSPQSLTAARWAADWCTRLHMRLRLLAVSGTVGTASRDISRGRLAEPADQQAELSARLELVRAGLTESHPTLSIDSVVLGGLPADQLIEASRAGALLVLGTRGLGPALSSLLGGVAEDVVTRAPGPVVVVPSTLTRAREHVITLGIDPQGPSFEAARFALEAAERMAVGLRVVACVEAGESPDRAAMMLDDSLATAIGDHSARGTCRGGCRHRTVGRRQPGQERPDRAVAWVHQSPRRARGQRPDRGGEAWPRAGIIRAAVRS